MSLLVYGYWLLYKVQHGQGQRQQLRTLPQRHDRGGVQGAGHPGKRAVCPVQYDHGRRWCWSLGGPVLPGPSRPSAAEPGRYPRPLAHHQTRQALGFELPRECHRTPGRFYPGPGGTHASVGEWKAVPQLLERLPLQPVSLTGDTGYNAGELRQLLEHRNITAYFPIHPAQSIICEEWGCLSAGAVR